jgi:hypothetical protein
MELLLNILWLGLVAPAIWVWRRKPECIQQPRWLGACWALLILGCALLLLFPVVSASDDLNAMRPEMEDSNPSAGSFKHSAGARSLSTHTTGTVPYQRTGLPFIALDEWHGRVWISSAELPELAPLALRLSRGPPATDLS